MSIALVDEGTRDDGENNSLFETLSNIARPATAPLAYCDYIADRIKRALIDAFGPDSLIKAVGPVKWDLHPEQGYMVSTKKTLEVTDRNGRRYTITVSEADGV